MQFDFQEQVNIRSGKYESHFGCGVQSFELRNTNSFNTSYLTEFIHQFYPQNGICIQKYNFCPKNDGEKWSTKNIFEIPPCGRLYFPLLNKSAPNHKFSNKNNYLPAWRDFKINLSRPFFTIIFRTKIVFLDTDFILRVKPMYESVK